MPPPPPVLDAIARLYEVLARYPAPTHDHYSPYTGITPEVAARLRRAPLRELAVDDLERYTRATMTTWGDVAQFKHYLPRIFELVATRPGGLDVPCALGKLDEAAWQTWPDDERDAIEAYLAALWAHALAAGPEVVDATWVLQGIGRARGNVTACLSTWQRTPAPAADRQLAELVLRYERELTDGGTLGRGWWPEDADAVLGLLAAPSTCARLAAAASAHAPGDGRRALAAAASTLARVFGHAGA